MAITIDSSPASYSSLHGALYFVVTSTNRAVENFKYVCDIYVNNNLVARLKSFPQPASEKGIFNVAPIVRNYWNSYFKPTGSTAFAYTGSDIYVSYQVKFGEDYGGTTYTNLQTQSATAYNYVQDYLYNPNSDAFLTPTKYDTAYAGFYLTNRDKTQVQFPKSLLGTGKLYTSFLSDAENTTKNISLDITRVNGTTSTNYTGATQSWKDYALIDISPLGINTYLGAEVIGEATNYYDVKAKIAGVQTDVIRVNLSCTQYDVIPLHFLNSVGGYETFHFTLVNRQSRSIERQSFERLQYEYESATTAMDMVDAYGRLYGGTIPFTTKQKLTYKLISDWVNFTDYNWLKELIASSEVYLQRGSQFVPVNISTTSWQEKKRFADKTFNLELDIDVAYQINSQYR
jgi:hypothetical protein